MTNLRVFNPDSHFCHQRTENQIPQSQSTAPTLNERAEALLDLHQQHLDAIQKATELIANLLGNLPGDHATGTHEEAD